MTDKPRCRTFDAKGTSICDEPARFVVWGHLFAKQDKGPKCAKHLPEMNTDAGLRFRAAIYEIPDTSARDAELRAHGWDEGADFATRHPMQSAEYIRAANPHRARQQLPVGPTMCSHPDGTCTTHEESCGVACSQCGTSFADCSEEVLSTWRGRACCGECQKGFDTHSEQIRRDRAKDER